MFHHAAAEGQPWLEALAALSHLQIQATTTLRTRRTNLSCNQRIKEFAHYPGSEFCKLNKVFSAYFAYLTYCAFLYRLSVDWDHAMCNEFKQEHKLHGVE